MCLIFFLKTKILLWGSIGVMCSFDEAASNVTTPKMVNLHDQNWSCNVPKMHMLFHMTWLCHNHIPTFINSFVSNWWFKFNCMVECYWWNSFLNTFKCIGFKCDFDFENVSLTKLSIFILFKAWMHNINDINQKCHLKIIISSMWL
jgi:hypothetical protein